MPPPPLDLVLTMIPGPGDRFQLALVDRQTGRPVPAQQLSTHNGTEPEDAAPAGTTIVTVTLLADLVPAGTYPVATPPPAPATPA